MRTQRESIFGVGEGQEIARRAGSRKVVVPFQSDGIGIEGTCHFFGGKERVDSGDLRNDFDLASRKIADLIQDGFGQWKAAHGAKLEHIAESFFGGREGCPRGDFPGDEGHRRADQQEHGHDGDEELASQGRIHAFLPTIITCLIGSNLLSI